MTKENETQINRNMRPLQEQNEELQTILDSIPAWVFYKDKENRFLKVNKAFCDIMDVSREELEGRSLFDLYPREQAEAYWKDDKEVMASGKPKANIYEPMDHPKRGRLWVVTDKIPYRDEKGNIIGILGFAIDVTARKHAEDELQAAYIQEKRLRQEKEQLADQLGSALARIRTLNSLLPICCVCKKIRDDNGRWHYIESYISSRVDTHFSHSYCPECFEKAAKESELIDKKTEQDHGA